MFVNPYTFVPLPASGPERGVPRGHCGATKDPLLSARLTLRITAQAPLLIRGWGTAEEPLLPSRPTGGGRTVILPGSGLHGAVRSLHETLTESCLRVLDTEWYPSYRQQVEDADLRRSRLVLVEDAEARTVRLCEPTHGRAAQYLRIGINDLTRLHAARCLRSGDRLHVDLDSEGRPSRVERDDQGEWVVFISDAGARTPPKSASGSTYKDKSYRAAIRRLSDDIRVVPEPVWQKFQSLIATTDDMRKARLEADGKDKRWTEVTVERGGRTHHLGMRSLARPTVHRGQPLWVRLDDQGQIAELRMAQIWRKSGHVAVDKRVGEFVPCTDPAWLCPSCRLFGSADVTGDKMRDGDRQRSYRGHVRVSDAVAEGDVKAREVMLPPMDVPRPGAGQFYLTNPSRYVGQAGTPPLREWGSAADHPTARTVRGRKFYWHTPSEEPSRRGEARRHHVKERATPAVLIPAGTRFTAVVTAVDVDAEQLGALLAALDPRDLLGSPDALVHLGGGRPLGYGSCRITIDEAESRIWPSAARYGAAPEQETSALLADSREAFAARRPRFGRTWKQLARALSAGAVRADRVWYPPGAGRPGDATYDEGFEFWRQSAGKKLADRDGVPHGYPLRVLPSIDDPDQNSTIAATVRPDGFRLKPRPEPEG